MIASEKIIEKFSKHCSENENLKKFLICLFDFETQENGWYTDEYEKLIKEHMTLEGNNENS
jgi:hypothetical protein